MAEFETFACPADLTRVGDEELATYHDRAISEFDRVSAIEDRTPELVGYAVRLTDDLDRIKAEQQVRVVRADLSSKQAQDVVAQQMARLSERVHGPADPGTGDGQDAPLSAEAITAAVVRGMTTVMATRERSARPAMASLSATRASAPDPQIPRAMLHVTSAMDLPARSLAAGANVPSIEALGEAFHERAKSIPATAVGLGAPRYQVASIRNEFTHTVDERTAPGDVESVIRELTTRDRQEALLAGGGWCAPSEIRYDLFNISDTPSGMIDMPTVGISRGGVQYPVSPSIADVFYTTGMSNAASGLGSFAFPFTNASDPWLWTEANDIAAVTGSPTKPVLRVPCATFSTTRLEVYGISLTAGNLTDSAYPEQTQNFLRLLRNAWAHAINARLITLMQNACTSFSGFPGSNAVTAFNGILSAAELAAVDYRNKFGMSDTAILELVLPSWALPLIRADLAWRVYGDDTTLSVSDADIKAMFADRGLAVQFVSDWQVRGSGQFGQNVTTKVTWGTTVQFMLYAAGTFLHGTGLSLDIGVLRDSVLNAANDYTAAWAEEAHLVAKVGHESRLYTTTFVVSGQGVAGFATANQPQV